MKKAKKFLVYASVLFAIVLAGCQKNTPNSSSNPGSSQTPTSSQISSSSVITSDSSVTPSSSSTRPSSSTPSSSKSSSSTPSSSTPSSSTPVVHVCTTTCPVCGGCLDLECTDPVCAEKCVCEPDPVVEPVDLVWTNDSFLVEAEDGLVQGVMTGTANDDSFIGERTSDNPEHPTSGGKVVFNWAEQGNTVTWKINAPEAEENIQITLWATCAFSQNSSGLSFSLNGTILPWNESTVNGKGSENKWYYWNALHTSGNLVQGENTIVITNASDESWNLDCLILAKAPVVTHTCESVCPICGKCEDLTCEEPECAEKCEGHTAIAFPENGRYRIEAESFINTSGGSVNIFDEETASNGKAIGDFFYPKSVSYEVITDQAYENLHLDAAYGLGQNNNENGAIEVLINGVKVHGRGWTQENHPAFDNIGMETTGWAITNVGSTNDFNLVEGKNTITLVAPYGSASNIDYIELVEADAEPIDPIDPVEPTFTPIVWDEEDKFLVEAEDALIEGVMTGTGPDDSFIGERASDNPEHPTSGGKVVFNWQQIGNTVTFKLSADAAEENVQFTFWATCAFSQNSSGLTLSLNGQSLSWFESTVEGQGSVNKWYYWNALHTSGNLVQGENTIVVTNTSGESWNLDCLVIAKAPVVTHVCESVCPTCGKCQDLECTDPVCAEKCVCETNQTTPIVWDVDNKFLVEAEDGLIEGTMTGTGETDAFIGERASDNPEHPTSGGKVVFNWANPGNTVTFKLSAAEAEENVQFTFWATCAFSQNSSGLTLSLNGQSLSWVESTVEGQGSVNKWYYWNALHTSGNLVQGENTIVITNISGESWNLDCLEISKYVAPAVDEFVNGTLRVEVENGVLGGGAAIIDQIEGETLSGGKGVGDFNGAASVTLTINSPEAMYVIADVRYALGMNNNQNQAAELYVNDAKIHGEIDNIGTNEVTGWRTWTNGLSQIFQLVEGENTIVLKAPYGSYTNLDYIELKQQNVLSFTENTARVEAEDGVLAGGATISTNEALSGGKGVGDFNGTATVTIKFSLLEETEVYAKIRYALGMDNNQNQAVELHVNGVKIKGEIDNIGTDEITGWSNYVDGLSAQFTLVKGENTIELKVPYGSGANLDFIEFIKVVPTV